MECDFDRSNGRFEPCVDKVFRALKLLFIRGLACFVIWGITCFIGFGTGDLFLRLDFCNLDLKL